MSDIAKTYSDRFFLPGVAMSMSKGGQNPEPVPDRRPPAPQGSGGNGDLRLTLKCLEAWLEVRIGELDSSLEGDDEIAIAIAAAQIDAYANVQEWLRDFGPDSAA